MPDNNKNFLRERLIGGLAAADFQVFAGMTVEQLLKQGSRLEACREPACYREIAQRLGVEYLVTGNVQVDKKNYDVAIDLISGRDGKGDRPEPRALRALWHQGGRHPDGPAGAEPARQGRGGRGDGAGPVLDRVPAARAPR